MSSHYAKPENALRKAEDLVAVNKESAALKTLHTILLSKRYRAWQPTHEKIMFLYLQLAVALRRNCKDALVQYRMICQASSFASLEKVVRHYLVLSEGKATEAQNILTASINASSSSSSSSSSVAAVAASVLPLELEDLEDSSPSELLVLAWSGAGGRSSRESSLRADRASLVPWIRYLWETYRTVLDVTRNNARLEQLYHEVARQAFDFARRYKRSHEFRRLGEILRHHIFNINKFAHQANAVDLNNSETQNRYLETRFEQLRIAADLELWQEAYRTIEDIHDNMKQSTAQPKPLLMRLYYEKLSEIFWASDNYLFHAYSLHKYYQLTVSDQTSSVSREESSSFASAVLLATLIIPAQSDVSSSGDVDESNEGNNIRLAALLGFKRETPSRARLLSELVSQGVVAAASEHAQQAYTLLEHGTGPLTLHSRLAPHLEAIRNTPALTRYSDSLANLAVVRVLQELAKVYQTIRMSSFLNLVPKFDADKMERVIMSAINENQVSLRVDHKLQLLVFSSPSLESSRFRSSIVALSDALYAISSRLDAANNNVDDDVNASKRIERQHVFDAIRRGQVAEHEAVFSRQGEIEKRKQEEEKQAADKERLDLERETKAAADRKAAEQKRMAEESLKREEERNRRAKQEHDLLVKKKLADDVAKKLESGVLTTNSKSMKNLRTQLSKDVESLDASELLRAQAEVLDAEKRDAEKRRRETLRRSDFLVRAMRIEEKEVLLKASESQKNTDREAFEADFNKFVETERLAHAKALKEKERLARMTEQRQQFVEKIMARRQAAHDALSKQQHERVKEAAIERRKRERAYEREQEEKRLEEELRAEAERKRQREAEEKARELEEQKAREREEAIEKKKKLDEIARKQREREEEIERREAEKRNASASSSLSSSSSSTSSGTQKWTPSFRRGGGDAQAGGGTNSGWVRPSDRDRGDNRDNRDSRDNRSDTRDRDYDRDSRDSRDNRDSRDVRDSRWSSSRSTGERDNRDSREPSSRFSSSSSSSADRPVPRWSRGGGSSGGGLGRGPAPDDREQRQGSDDRDSNNNNNNSNDAPNSNNDGADDGFERVSNSRRGPGRR